MEHMTDIAAQEAAITKKLLSNLIAIPNVRVLDEDLPYRLPVMAFVIEGMDAETAGFALSRSFNIDCRTGLHCAPLLHKAPGMPSIGTIRFSPSYTNTPAEIDYALEAVRRIAG
jgi:selenocysteine lyase/cysteine desulfurase